MSTDAQFRHRRRQKVAATATQCPPPPPLAGCEVAGTLDIDVCLRTAFLCCVTQAKREDLERQVIMLSRMVEEMSTEHEQLQAERDQLGACVSKMQAQQPQHVSPQITGVDPKARSLLLGCCGLHAARLLSLHVRTRQVLMHVLVALGSPCHCQIPARIVARSRRSPILCVPLGKNRSADQTAQ